RDLAQHLFFDDVLISLHPFAVKRRDQEFAALAMLVAVEAECRPRAEDDAEGRRPAHEGGAAGEKVLYHRAAADHPPASEDRQIQRDRGAIPPAQRTDGLPACGHEADPGKDFRNRRRGWKPHGIRRRLTHLVPCLSDAHRRRGTPTYHPYGTHRYRTPTITCP